MKSTTSILQKCRNQFWKHKIESFRKRHRNNPASLESCLQLNTLAEKRTSWMNPLYPRDNGKIKLIQKGSKLAHLKLAGLLRDEELGKWSLTVEVINWLEEYLQKYAPRRVIEFGSGISTLVLTSLLSQIHSNGTFRILSIDQRLEDIENTQKMLKKTKYYNSCQIVHAPLVPTFAGDRATFSYQVSAIAKEYFNWLGKADFVLIDGPYSQGPARYSTLLQVLDHLAPGARFVMDDGLREKELFAASLWQKQGLHLEGVLTLGKGVVLGKVN